MSRWMMVSLAAVALLAAPASAQYIGIFGDRAATSCAVDAGPTPWIDLHVVAVLGGSVTEMTGAQFQIAGAPESWDASTVLWVPEPDAISLGHPLFATNLHPDTPGVNVAFGTCQRFADHVLVPLGRVVLLGAPTPQGVHLRVTGFELVPPDPRCPFVVDCIAPVYSKVCVGGGEIVLNGAPPSNCQAAVTQSTWMGVKSLYR